MLKLENINDSMVRKSSKQLTLDNYNKNIKSIMKDYIFKIFENQSFILHLGWPRFSAPETGKI